MISEGIDCNLGDIEVSPHARVTLGDCVHLGQGVRIVGRGTVRFGDYSKVHDGCFINVPYEHSIVEFGCNTWIGSRSVLDGTGGIIASHNVGVGIASQLYSHIAHGDVMAGCRFKSEKELIIGKDAWFVGQCLVSPVAVGERSIAMLGSTIVHDMQPNRVYGGCPAKDITDKVGEPWYDRPTSERLMLMDTHIDEFRFLTPGSPPVTVLKAVLNYDFKMEDHVTYFNVTDRTYTKRLTLIEREFMKWFTSYRGRFTPRET